MTDGVTANGDGLNKADEQGGGEGLFGYTIDWRNTSNTWADEFTVDETPFGVQDGLADLIGITTPCAKGDYDGKMNVWYRTTLPREAGEVEMEANATLSDGHANPWLDGVNTAVELGDDGRALSYDGWSLWRSDVSTTDAEYLSAEELDLAQDERIVSIRFEYGRVDIGFTTRGDGWDRDDIKDPHDDIASIPDGNSGELAPAIIHIKATEGYTAGATLQNYASVDVFRNGGGEGLMAHDSDLVEQKAGTAPAPLEEKPPHRKSGPFGDMPQTGDFTAALVATVATGGITAIAAGLAKRRRRQSKTGHLDKGLSERLTQQTPGAQRERGRRPRA